MMEQKITRMSVFVKKADVRKVFTFVMLNPVSTSVGTSEYWIRHEALRYVLELLNSSLFSTQYACLVIILVMNLLDVFICFELEFLCCLFDPPGALYLRENETTGSRAQDMIVQPCSDPWLAF